MSLLSTFAILFETDARQATRETENFSDALDDVEDSAEGAAEASDLFASMGQRAGSAASSAAKDIAKMAAAYFTVNAVVDGIIDNALGIDTIGKLSQTLDFNIVKLDAWGAATERNGGSAEAFRGTIESLQGSLQDISITGGGEIINTLAMIGIQATKANGEIKGAFEILPEIADAFSKMSTAQSFAFGKRLGLDQGTILTLQQSRYEVDKLVERQKALGGVTKEGYEAAAIFNDQWDDSKRSFNALWLSANSTILPLLSNMLSGIEKITVFIKENQTLVEGFFIGVGGVITAAYLPAIWGAIGSTLIFIATLAWVAAPFVVIAAAVAAVGVGIAILYEDFQAWSNGSKSAIGEVLKAFEDLKSNIKGVFDIMFGALTKDWRRLVDFIDGTSFDFFDFSGKPDTGSGFADKYGGSANNNALAQATIANYSATNLNQGGSSVNQRTQQNNINIGGSTVDARGMSSNQAKNAINASMKESVEMALGQLEDGVQR